MDEQGGGLPILCVDDEPNILEALERNLYEHFDVHTATGGAEGLELVKNDGPFAVVVSDMRMPGMSGAVFLSRVREIAPDTVRILLTGHAEFEAAIAAVNEGNIFRFLLKPCPDETLLKSLKDAAEQYRLITAEKELLEKTLAGSAKVFIDVLSLAAPVAFSRANTIKKYVAHMAARLDLPDKWQYELAAMLAQIGCITLPPDTLDRVYAGREISEEEQQMIDEIPSTGYRLLASIPRFEPVAEMIKRQRDDWTEGDWEDAIKLGAQLVRIAIDTDKIVTRGKSVRESVEMLRKRGEGYSARLLDALSDFHSTGRSEIVRTVTIHELRTFMILDEDVQAKNGTVIVNKGREVDLALMERLKNFAQRIGIVEPIRVRIPS